MQDKNFFRQLGLGVASLTFGVALSIFIFAFYSGMVNSMQAFLLYLTSFLLMLRFWWKYTEIFIRLMPSHTFLQFLLDFLISFFGILAVLFVDNIQTWAAIGIAAMAASAVRCGIVLDKSKEKQMLRRTFWNSIVMIIIMSAVYFLSSMADQILIAGSLLILVLLFLFLARK